jgi:Protein of unknown function (DUF2490)
MDVVKRGARTRTIAGMGALLLTALMSGPATRADVRDEIWPELDLWFHLTAPLQLLLTETGVRDSESGDKSQGAFGAFLDYRVNDHISVRAGYRYLENLTLTTGARENVEHREVYDFNYSWHVGERARIVDRTRIDVRDQEGKTSYRYRNRLLVNQPIEIHRVKLIPYASAEAFYDTKYDQVNRLQFRLGSALPTGPNVVWDFYLARQRDTYPVTKFVNALGVTLNVKY